MTAKLFIQAITKFISGIILVGVLLFLPAGTFSFFNGWLFVGVLFVPMFFAGIVMMFKNPGLLKSRLNAKEKQQDQSLVVKLSGLMFLAGFVVAGLGVRFNWYILPTPIVIGATVMFLVAYILYAEVLRENTYLSRTVEVQENQKVIDTGLYGIIRHPMDRMRCLPWREKATFLKGFYLLLMLYFLRYFLCLSLLCHLAQERKAVRRW